MMIHNENQSIKSFRTFLCLVDAATAFTAVARRVIASVTFDMVAVAVTSVPKHASFVVPIVGFMDRAPTQSIDRNDVTREIFF